MLNIVKGQTLYVLMPDNMTIKPTNVIDIEQIYTEAESPTRYLDIYTRYIDSQTNGMVVFHPCDVGTILFESEAKANIQGCLNRIEAIAEDFYKNGCGVEDFQIYRLRSFADGIQKNIHKLSEAIDERSERNPMDTGLVDKNGTPICIGDRTRLVLEDGEVREFDVCLKTVTRSVKSHPDFDGDYANVSITGIVFSWNGYDTFPIVDETGVSDVSKMEVI